MVSIAMMLTTAIRRSVSLLMRHSLLASPPLGLSAARLHDDLRTFADLGESLLYLGPDRLLTGTARAREGTKRGTHKARFKSMGRNGVNAASNLDRLSS